MSQRSKSGRSPRRISRANSASTAGADRYDVGLRRQRTFIRSTGSPANEETAVLLDLQLPLQNGNDFSALPVPPAGKLEASAPIVLDGTSHPLLQQKRSSSLSSSMRLAWKLKYQDFLPNENPASPSGSGKQEKFKNLVDRANEWLQKTSHIQVKSCETITWMSHDPKSLDDSETMMISKRITENVGSYATRGLRLWLIPRIVNRPQVISYEDFTPSEPTDTVSDLVTNVNQQIEQNLLKGQILSVETVDIPIVNKKIDSELIGWIEYANDDSPYAFGLRVFYNREVNGRIYGSDRTPQIGIQDMVPLANEGAYEGFEDLLERTNAWLKERPDIVVTNLQSVMVQKATGPQVETGNACFYSQPGINRPHPVDFFRILRIAYLTPTGDLLVELPTIHPVTFETFTPDLVKVKDLGSNQKERLEKMKETFSKVIAFLQASDVDVVCVETVCNPMQFYPPENAQSLQQPIDEIKFLLTIRLYLSGRLNRQRDGSARSIKRSSVVSGNKFLDENEHPGPIFLSHVVCRQFKYRWLVLGISVITCMTIIVIVSVVYSNL